MSIGASTIAATLAFSYICTRAMEFSVADIDTKTKWLAKWVGLGKYPERDADREESGHA